MIRIFSLMFIGLALASCGNDATTDVIMQQCGDYTVEIKTSPDGDKIDAVLNGDSAVLVNTVAASGAKFDGVINDTAVTLWNKGDNWTLIMDDDMVIECVAK